MKIILILQDESGKISHHCPIDEKQLSNTERELTRLKKKVIYKLFIKMAFSIQRYEAAS